MKVKYTGTSNFQGFDKADFAKAGVESKKVMFARDEPTEVDDAVGEALVSKDGIFGDFSFEEVKDSEDATDNSEANAAHSGDSTEGAPVGKGATSQESIATPAVAGATKKATSSSTR